MDIVNLYTNFFLVENFDLFEKLTEELLYKKMIVEDDNKPIDYPILFSEPSLHNKESRGKLTEIMFEKFGIPAMFICKSAVLSA
jgi:actin-related protein